MPIGVLVAVLMVLYINRPPVWYGMIVAAFGEWIQVCAAAHLRKQKDLAASGPYLYVRNPMYVGRFFVLLGFFLMAHNWYMTVAYVLLFAIYVQPRVKREETRLIELFGDDYVKYCRNVNRWIPRVKPYDAWSGRRFDWNQVKVNHEHLNVIGVLVLFTAIYVRIHCFASFVLFK
jgi:protein-S-isoprenylcysteine O-methyltransferase Ste14